MKERIKQLIVAEGMNQAQFAQRVNIQSSTLSHALSGRNEVSRDIISKIHQAYPTISIKWLMFGEGAMYEGGTHSSIHPPMSSNLFQEATPLPVPPPPVPETAPTATHSTSSDSASVASTLPPRRVTKIMVFYSDNSFETFSSDLP